MKTNHRRSYVDPGSFRDPAGLRLTKRLETKAVAAHSLGGDFVNGHRGAARAKSGAKKYLRVQERLEGKRICRGED